MATTDSRSPLLHSDKEISLSRCISHRYDELSDFRRWLKWLCFDQSNPMTASLSWFVFLGLTAVVPAVTHFVLPDGHNGPYDAVAQIALSGVSALSFFCMSGFVRKYGLRRFLFFDKLRHESESVRKDYTTQFNKSLKLLFIFVLPCFVVEAAYKIWWWYISGRTSIPLLRNAVACVLELCSWFYRTTSFFLVCVLFRLTCHLQILRLHDFARVFQADSDVESILREHLRIRRHLRIISHRFRLFILCALIFITASLFAALFMTTSRNADDTVGNTGQLAVCSVSLLAGLTILLRSATRITHKAQAVTGLAAKWHVCATIDSFDELAEQTQDNDEEGETGDDEEDDCMIVPYNAVSYQRRQAFVTYLENNRAGITIYGFMLDRTTLHTIFCFELSLVLWLLGKTIGIS